MNSKLKSIASFFLNTSLPLLALSLFFISWGVLTIHKFILALLLLCFAWQYVTTGFSIRLKTPALVLPFLMIASGLTAGISSGSNFPWHNHIAISLLGLGIYLALLLLLGERTKKQTNCIATYSILVISMAIGGALVAGEIILEFINGSASIIDVVQTQQQWLLLVVPNDITFLIIFIPLLLSISVIQKKAITAIFLLIYILLTLTAISFLQSRTAIVCLIISAAIFSGIYRPKLLALTFVILLPSIVLMDYFLGHSMLVKRWDLGARREIWTTSFAMIADKPWLGHGGLSFSQLYQSYQAVVPDKIDSRHMPWPHNLYIEVLVERGITGLIIFLAIIYRNIKILIQSLSSDHNYKLLACGLLSAWSAFLFAALVELSFIRYWVIVIFFTLWAMTENLSKPKKFLAPQ